MRFFFTFLFMGLVGFVWGQFGRGKKIISCSNAQCLVKQIYCLDLNGDDEPEILTLSGGGTTDFNWRNTIRSYKNRGALNFGNAIRIYGPTSIDEMYPADMDNDGYIDIVSVGYDGIVVHFNDRRGFFPENNNITVSEEGFGGRVKIWDIDNDGYKDIIFFKNNSINIFEVKNISGREFSDANQLIYYYNREFFNNDMELVDVDSNGQLDVVIASGNGLFLIKDYQNSQFQQVIKLSNDDFFSSVKTISVLDFDKDGDMDLIVSGYRQPIRILARYENDGLGNFSEEKLLIENMNSYDFAVLDFDLDNDQDIVLQQYLQESKVLENEKHFFRTIPFTLGEWYSNITVNDVDNDNNEDLIVTKANGDIYFFRNIASRPTILGKVFFDENLNSSFDTTEQALNNFPILVNPRAISSYTDSDGTFRFYLSNGIYTLTVQPDTCWQLSTDSLSYTVTIDENTILSKDFGFQLVSDYQSIQPSVNSGTTRCGFEVPFWITVENNGCVPSEGQFGLVLEEKVNLASAIHEPDEVLGDTLLWNYKRLVGSESEQVYITLQIAGPEFIGDTIRMKGLSYFRNDQDELILNGTYDYTSEIRCAYDPNDKLVRPNRTTQYDRNYTLFEETLEYTVRFQNTGNDTAFTVIIRDYLDENLDWQSLKPVAASHLHETMLHPNGLLEFSFNNILLPDSTINEPLSHGFVTYKINTKANLAENTEIKNTANIYFDFNPPIRTNTTNNILVSELPKTTNTINFHKESITVYPNPFENSITFSWKNAKYRIISLFDVQGKILERLATPSNELELSSRTWRNGLYFYQISDENGKLLNAGKLVKN